MTHVNLHLSRQKNAEPEPKKKSFEEIMAKAGKSALRGGVPGMISMCVQVLGLMWMRTTMNYQYANGLSTLQALRTLYADGGIPRFYKGLAPALIQGPLSVSETPPPTRACSRCSKDRTCPSS